MPLLLPQLAALLLLPGGLLGDGIDLGGILEPTTGPNSSVRIEPPRAPPGTTVTLVFTTTSPDLVELVLAGRASCVVHDPLGAVAATCDRNGPLAEVNVGSETREFAFPFQAPAKLGTYRVHFQADSLLTLLPATYSAEATFQVVPPPAFPPAEGTPDADDPYGPPAGPNGTPGPGEDDGSALGDDATDGGDLIRWLVSSLLGGAVTTVALVARRWRLRGLA